MKKNLLTASAVFLFALSGANAQLCSYYFLQNNKTIEMSMYNRKGDPDGKAIYVVSGVKNGGGTVTSNLNSEMFNKKGKSLLKGTGKVECKGGILLVDMKMLLPQAQQEQFAKGDVKGEGMYLEYTGDMKVGEQLKDGNMNMEIDNGGMKHTVNMVINNRKVEAKEPVTTSAGTWDCYKISFKTKVTIKTMGVGIPVSFEGTEWYAPGFGIVKSENKHGSMAVTSIK
jgi:hypothetical protein